MLKKKQKTFNAKTFVQAIHVFPTSFNLLIS